MASAPGSYARYLSAKQSVDDRALNRAVFAELGRRVLELDAPLRVLELGGGVGTMLRRLAESGLLGDASYTLLDRDADSVRAARRELAAWAGVAEGDELRVQRASGAIAIELVEDDLFAFLERARAASYDLVIANAVLDLLDVPALLPQVWRVLAPERWFWSTINFDGETIFLPEHALDAAVTGLYHRSMDLRAVSGGNAGDSRSGRHLFEHVTRSGGSVLAGGSSDWVVHARAGSYPADEAHFLHAILNTVENELAGHAELEPAAFAAWVAARRAQIERAELTLIVKNLDLLASRP